MQLLAIARALSLTRFHVVGSVQYMPCAFAEYYTILKQEHGEVNYALHASLNMTTLYFLSKQKSHITKENEQPDCTTKACNPPSGRWFPVVDSEKANGQRQENHNRQIS